MLSYRQSLVGVCILHISYHSSSGFFYFVFGLLIHLDSHLSQSLYFECSSGFHLYKGFGTGADHPL
jgi:hypothetical protein